MLRSALKWSLRSLRRPLAELGGWIGVVRGLASGPDQLISSWPSGEVALGPRVALFVHFDRHGVVRRYVLDYLTALREAGLAIAFVSNSGRLDPASMSALQAICAAVLVRRNVGYDFGAMREGLMRLGLPRPDTELVVIANDSVYGPLRPLPETLARIDFGRAALWGATESWQRRYHLQSYFLVAGREALTSDAWRGFWSSVRPVYSKYRVVSQYEVGLTQRLLAAGLECAAVWPYRDLLRRVEGEVAAQTDEKPSDPFSDARKAQLIWISYAMANRLALNPTADLWRQLLEAGFPFIKRELLNRNPARVHDIIDWRHAVAGLSPAHIDSVERDLQRVVRNRAP